MDKKIIASLLGSVLIAFTFMFIIPIGYAAISMRSFYAVTIFIVPAIITVILGVTLSLYGKGHRRRLPIFESALSMLIIYPLVAAIGMIPFVLTGWLLPFDAILETISDVTSGGLSLLSPNAPYILRIWQSLLMWFGSLIFLVMLVTIMPEVSGCFGLSMSLQGGRLFSPLFGQMNAISQHMIKTYSILTLLSFILFKLAGLNFWDAFLMAIRCISTGGGDFFPESSSVYVEYAAIFSMLLACGNFLMYYRFIQTLPPPPRSETNEKNFPRAINYFKRLRQNFLENVKTFATNSEVRTCAVIIFFSVMIISLKAIFTEEDSSVNVIFRHVLFHVVSYLSTTGINLVDFDTIHDFDRFSVFLMAIFGGCMGSVTGGLKMVRVLVLFKSAAVELKKTIHPHMITNIRVNDNVVAPKIVGRILGFFFLACITLFICSALLSFMGPKFSEAVSISAACLTNVGTLPQIVNAEIFLRMSDVAKIFCSIILVVGRIEMFALLIVLANLKQKRGHIKW
ncbi:MAG: TrkH family potassium uptake protein [Selenomonadaceae bacterium]|nr:TrkH family potassium uptake protein [Selenomonadaceae bacterium]